MSRYKLRAPYTFHWVVHNIRLWR